MTRVTGAWLSQTGTLRVLDMLEGSGHTALYVGGCVRDALIGQSVSDIDIATNAHPDMTLQLAETAGLKALPTGIDHGTITVISDEVPYEVTTFRRDIETDGRHAVVAFSDRVEDDAARRDFTMNALYADRAGHVMDPVGTGLADLMAGRVRFIGDARDRIREDYLRILRFFRFHAVRGDHSRGLEAEDLAAIAENIGGLDTLAPERIGQEMRKLLAAMDPVPSLASMAATGVLRRVMPGFGLEVVHQLVALEETHDVPPSWLRRLTAIGGEDLGTRLRLSRSEKKGLTLRRGLMERTTPVLEIAYRHDREVAVDVALLRASMFGLRDTTADLELAAMGGQAVFPIRAADLMPVYEGAALGRRLKSLEDQWIASEFKLTRAALLRDDN